MQLKKKSISACLDANVINFHRFDTKEASLVVYESGSQVPFDVKRVFTVKVNEGCSRGFHAHKLCSQLLVCLQGRCIVTVDDGMIRKEIILDCPHAGLLIPPTIWAEQTYEANTILMVLTDQLYDEADYIRNYEDFLQFRKAS